METIFAQIGAGNRARQPHNNQIQKNFPLEIGVINQMNYNFSSID